MSKPAPSLPESCEREVVRHQLSARGEVWILDLACGHVVTRRMTPRRRDQRPTTARCPQCAGVKTDGK